MDTEHLCSYCVLVRPVVDDDGQVYRHCLADTETSYAAKAAAAVAEQLQHQQSLLMAAIDYNLVYALHSFVATLEGQVCVLKGDPLALLDDTNSYWWLVRCCKTDEIGYIPAENVETPSERVARLNRIRNVQLALVTESDFGSTDDDTGAVEISLAALEAEMNQPFDEDAMIFPRPNTALKFAAEPQIFEESFLGEDYDDLIDVDDQVDDAVVVEEEFMDDAVSTGYGTEDNVDSKKDGNKDAVKDSSVVGSVVDTSPTVDDDDVAYKKPPSSPPQQQRSGSFWSRLRRNLSNPSIGVVATVALSVTEEKPRTGRKQSIDQGAPNSRSSSRNRSSDVKPIQTTKPAYGSAPSLPATPPKATAPETIRVLRIYSGNVDLSASATFKTVVWSQETTVQDLLVVQNAAPGEYYLSILHFDSQERRLPESENIYKILEQLSNKKLPGLSTSKTVTKILSNTNNDANNTQILINDDQIIKIIINRNIHLVDDEQQNDARLLRVFMVDELGTGRTYKTVSVPRGMNVDALVALGFKKFKILKPDSVGDYRLVTIASGGKEAIRDSNELIHEILDTDIHEQVDFFLQRKTPKPATTQQDPITIAETNIIRASLSSAHELQSNTTSITSLPNSPITSPALVLASPVSPSSPRRSSNLSISSPVAPSPNISITPKNSNNSNGSLGRTRSITPPLDTSSAKFEESVKRNSVIKQAYDDMEKVLEVLEKNVGADGSVAPAADN
ncbi:UNVERIFIED_CONTAM: hypothetical protein HDU68_006059 [Siphonaria sp. JEL0065]|nr:hypothetical protein HDU68_006059 [Siphonaria sp. JEL0065]